ncbi:MAG: DUF2281 domain-containing protein [Oscillospiraceae bacterium]|jgi:hypothetical protein|nr:DUF2281 domain-containing protein [Oscillospiraceae bacterium]
MTNIMVPDEEIEHKSKFAELLGRFEGQIFMADDFNEPLEEFKDYM